MIFQADFASILLLLGTLQAILIIAFLTQRIRHEPRVYLPLGLLVAASGYLLFSFLVVNSNLYQRLPHFIYTSGPVLFLLGPFFYLFVRGAVGSPFGLYQWWHLAPFLAALAYQLPVAFQSAEQKILVMDYALAVGGSGVPVRVIVYVFVYSIINMFYCIAAIKALGDSTNLAGAEQARLLNMSRVYLGFWVLSLVTAGLLYTWGHMSFQFDLVNALMLSGLIHGLTYYWVIHLRTGPKPGSAKYANSTLEAAQLDSLVSRLQDRMEGEKAFLANDLSLKDLAGELNVSTHHLSQALNQRLHVGFFEYLNSLRVREFLALLQRPECRERTITELAFEAGFNNKNTFHRVFKDHTGTTPTRYRSEIENSGVDAKNTSII